MAGSKVRGANSNAKAERLRSLQRLGLQKCKYETAKSLLGARTKLKRIS